MEIAEYDLMDAVEERMWWYRALHLRVLDALHRRPGAPGALLDAGCGTGGLLRRLAGKSTRALVGLEFNPEAARRAGAKSGALTTGGDANRLPFAGASFGALVSMDVLCHRAVDPSLALAEFHRVLKPGGALVLNLPAFEWLHSAHVIRVHNARRFTAAQARELLAAMPGVVVVDDLDAKRYPMPRDCSGRDEVFVGRIREDASSPTGIALWCVSDNLRKGAATNAVQIAELLAAGRRTGAATVRA